MTEQEITENGEAFADYHYETGEDGMFCIFQSRDKTVDYICAFVRAALETGWMWSVGENREAFIAISDAKTPVPFKVMMHFLRECIHILGFGTGFRLVGALMKGGTSLEDEMKKKKKPYIKIEMLCVRKAYQGRGYMRKAMEIAFQMAQERGVPCILDTDEKLKMDKYCHLGMKLVKTRKVGEKSYMYDLIKTPR